MQSILLSETNKQQSTQSNKAHHVICNLCSRRVPRHAPVTTVFSHPTLDLPKSLYEMKTFASKVTVFSVARLARPMLLEREARPLAFMFSPFDPLNLHPARWHPYLSRSKQLTHIQDLLGTRNTRTSAVDSTSLVFLATADADHRCSSIL